MTTNHHTAIATGAAANAATINTPLGALDAAFGELGKPAFSVHKNGTNQGSVASSVATLVTWSTEEQDTNSNFASNRFTPTTAGNYLLVAGVEFSSAVDASAVYLMIYKNGAEYKSVLERCSGTSNQSFVMTAKVSANGSSDYFEVYVLHTFGSAATITGLAVRTFFQGHRVSE